MNVVPGFVTIFCFDGREAAIKRATETQKIVTFWHEKRRVLAVPCAGGKVAELGFETKNEVFAAAETLSHFGLAHGGDYD